MSQVPKARPECQEMSQNKPMGPAGVEGLRLHFAVCVWRWSAGCAVCFVEPTTNTLVLLAFSFSFSLLFLVNVNPNFTRRLGPFHLRHVIDHVNLVVVVAFLLRMFWRRYDYSNSYCLTNSFQETGELFALLYGACEFLLQRSHH
jgi:hypothetical protein